MNRYFKSFTILALSLVFAVAFASVFVYYPVDLTITGASPPVILEEGSNANQPDLMGNIISVTIGQNGTSASIQLHPTYQKTYYKNITIINNTDAGNSYYITIRISDALNGLPAGSSANMIIYDKNGVFIANINLMSTGTYSIATLLSASSWWRIDFEIYIPEGVLLSSITDTLVMEIIYSTSNETPP